MEDPTLTEVFEIRIDGAIIVLFSDGEWLIADEDGDEVVISHEALCALLKMAELFVE